MKHSLKRVLAILLALALTVPSNVLADSQTQSPDSGQKTETSAEAGKTSEAEPSEQRNDAAKPDVKDQLPSDTAVRGRAVAMVAYADGEGFASFDSLEAAVAAAGTGEGEDILSMDISLASNITIGAPLEINKSITIDGGGKTITAGAEMNEVILIGSNDVTLKNLTVDGANTAEHGIQAWHANDVSLQNVTAKNSNGYGVLVNGSAVTAEGLNTSGNAWGGVNVDTSSDPKAASFTMSSGTLAEAYSIIVENDSATVPATLNVSGGNFQGVGINPEHSAGLIVGNVTGGNYATGVQDVLIAEGMKYDSETGTIVAANYVAEIGEGAGRVRFESLAEALAAAQNRDTVKLLVDVDATTTMYSGDTRFNLWINKSITLDGAGHILTIKGRGIGIQGADSNIDVTLSNIIVKNIGDENGRCIDTRGKLSSLTLNNVTLTTEESGYTGYLQPLTIGGNQADATNVTIIESSIIASTSANKGYAIITFNPVNMTIEGSSLKGWACLNLKGPDGSAGSNGSLIRVTDSTLVSANSTPGYSNSYSLIKIEDNNVHVEITDSSITVNGGDNLQSIVSFQKPNQTIAAESTVSLGTGNNVTLEGNYSFASGEGNSSKLAISGGIFNVPVPEEACAEGYIPKDNGDGTFTVKLGAYIAQVGEVKYETLDEAINAANGQTIILLADAEYTLPAGETLKVNPNGKIFTIIAAEGCILNTEEAEGVFTYNAVQAVAKIGDTLYATLQEAVAASQTGDTVEVIVAGTYTLPGLPRNIMLEGKVEGVAFNHTGTGNIAAIPNGATFKNVSFIFGNNNYHGFQHNGGLTFENCTFNGKFFTDGNETYTNCTFNQTASDYHVWVYGGPSTITFDTCTFSGSGKFIHVYNETSTNNKLIVKDCIFINNGAANKAAINVKETGGTRTTALKCEVEISGAIVLTGSFPDDSKSADTVFTGNGLFMVDDRLLNGAEPEVHVLADCTVNGTTVQEEYPAYVAEVTIDGTTTKYTTLQGAVNAAHALEGDVTVTLLTDTVENVWIHQKLGLNLTITGDSENKPTVKGNLIIDGDGDFSASRTDTLTIENLKVVKDSNTTLKYSNALIIFPATSGVAASQTFIGNHNNYAHHVTIQNCEFDANGDQTVAAIRSTTGGGCFKDATFSNLVASNMHSLAQFNASSDFHFDGCKATNVKNGINVSGGNGNGSINNTTIDALGYAFRFATTTEGGTVTLTNNTFSGIGTADDDGAVVTRDVSGTNASTVKIESGYYNGKINASDTNKKIVITGGFFKELPPAELCGTDADGNQLYPIASSDADYPYTVGVAVAVVDNVGYTIFADAVAASDNGTKVITLLADIEEPYTLQSGSIQVAHNGKTLTVKAPEGFVLKTSETEGITTYTVQAAVAKIGDVLYATLKEAVRAAEDGDTVTLLANVTESFFVPDGERTITIDLGGFTMTGDLLLDDGPNVTVQNGTIAGTVTVYGGTTENHNSFTLASDAVINAAYGIILREAYGTNGPDGTGSTININGTVNGIVWVMGNILAGDSVINVNNGAEITGDDVGIALNGAATLNIAEGATVTGTATGIEVRAGKLNVTGGTIIGNGAPTEVTPNGNGTTSTGAGIAVAQHTTKLPIEVCISGGEIKGFSAFYESNPENNSAEDIAKVKLSITGGTFTATAGGTAIVYSENKTALISGGTYSLEPDAKYIVPEKAAVKSGDVWTIGDAVAQIGTTGYATLAAAIEAVQDTETITLLTDSPTASANNGKTFTIAMNGHTLTGITWVTDDTTLTLDGSIEGSTYNGSVYVGYADNNNGNIILDGGTYTCASGNTVLHINGTCLNSNVTIKNAKITSPDDNGIQLNGKGTFVIENSEITGATGVYVKSGNLTITDSKITGNMNPVNYNYNGNGANPTGDAIVIDACEYPGGAPTVIIGEGNTFTATKKQIGYYEFDADNDGNTVPAVVRSVTNELTLSDGYAWTKDDNDYVIGKAVAQIGDTLYASLKDAVEAVPANGTATTITMIADETINVTGYALTIPAGKNIVLDLNGKTVVGACTISGTSALIRNLGTLTINDSSDPSTGKLIGGADPTWTWDGSDDYSGSYASNLIRNEGTLTVNGGTLYNASSGSAAYAIDNYSAGKVTINGGVVDAKKASAIRMFYCNGGAITVNGGAIGRYISDDDCCYMGIQVMGGTDSDVIITGGTIAGNWAFYSNGTGESSVGISNGTFDGYVGFGSTGPADIAISGGTFLEWVGTYGNQTGFISGGKYAEEPDAEYIAPGKCAIKDGEYWIIGEAVAQIGTIGYATLADAFAAAQDGDTIKLLKDCAGNGIIAPQGKFTTGLTVDFDGHTYTVDGTTVGSAGTETNGFQLLMGNTITFKNGTITSEKASILVQNYSNLTLEGMTLTLNNANDTGAYTLSDNNGKILIKDTTINANPAGGFAFDVCRYSSYPSVNVTVDGSSIINGNIEVYASGNDTKNGFSLALNSGTLNGTIVMDPSAGAAMAVTPDKVSITKAKTFEATVSEGYKWIDQNETTHKLVLCYTVTIDLNGGTHAKADADGKIVIEDVARLANLQSVINEAITIDGVVTPPAKTNYGFDKWLIVDGTDNIELTDDTQVLGPVTVIAKYIGDPKLVIYTDGIDGILQQFEVAYGDPMPTFTDTAKLPLKTARDTAEQHFTYHDNDLWDAEIAEFVERDYVYNLKWIEVFTLKFTYTIDGEEFEVTQLVEHGQYATAPTLDPAPSEVGKTFIGWFDGNNQYDFTTPVTANLTLVAKFEVNEHTVTFMDGSEEIAKLTVPYDNPVTAPADPTREGHIFAGWFKDDSVFDFATPITEDITLTAHWTEAVAKIGDTLYATLAEAFAAAETGDTIVLLKDVAELLDVPAGKTVTLDLNGKTLTVDPDGGYNYINGDLTIDGTAEGSKVVVEDYGIVPKAGSKLTINGGEFTGDGYYMFYVMGGELVIKNGTFSNDYNIVNCYASGDYALGGKLTINGGEFTVTDTEDGTVVMGFENSEITIHDGIFNGTYAFWTGEGSLDDGVEYTPAKATINGGTFNGEVGVDGDGTLNIDGGTFNDAVYADGDGTLVVSDGRYTDYVFPEDVVEGKLCTTEPKEDDYFHIVDAVTVIFDAGNGTDNIEVKLPKGEAIPSADIPEDPEKDGAIFAGWFKNGEAFDFETIINEDTTLTAQWTEAVAKIGDTLYATLAEAIAAAQDGDTVELLKDITADLDSVTDLTAGVFNIDKNITINGNGHTVSASGEKNVHIFNVLSGTAAIENIVLDGNGKAKSGIHAYADTNVTLTNVESKNNTGAGVIVNGATVTATDLKTSGNAWGGVNVDARDGHNAEVAIGGESKLEETYSVYTDNTSSANVTVTINGGEYNNVAIVAGDNTTINITDGTFNAVGKADAANGTIAVSDGQYKVYVAPENVVEGKLCTTVPDASGYYHIVDAIKVTFDANGGNFGKDENDALIDTKEILVPKGETIPAADKPADPVKEGFVFGGWLKDDVEFYFGNAIIEEITLTAKWTAGEYTITFVDEDGITQLATITAPYNTEITAPADPTKDGFIFVGWNQEIPGTMPAENLTIQAQWTEAVAKIGDELYATLAEAFAAAQNGDTIVLLKDVAELLDVPAGKTVTLDLNGKTLTVDPDGGYNYINGDLTIDGTAEGSKVDVKNSGIAPRTGGKLTINGGEYTGEDYMFYLVGGELVINDGSFTGVYNIVNCYASGDYALGGKVTINGGEFTVNDPEWDGTAVMGFENSEITINGGVFSGQYAFVVGHDTLNSGVDHTPGKATITDGTFNGPVVVNGDGTLTIDGGIFNDTVTADGDGTLLVSDGSFKYYVEPEYVVEGKLCTTVPGDDGYYHIVDAIKVTFDANGGNFGKNENEQPITTKEVLVPKGEAVPEAEVPAPEREGGTFSGWNPEIPASVTEDTTLTAQWTATITFKNGDEVLQSTEVAYGEMPVYNGATPTKAADDQFTYTFTGWDPEIVEVAGPATYTAVFDPIGKPYTITWVVDSFEIEVEFAFGSTIKAPKDPTKEGYIFAGWLPAIPETMPAENLRIVAQWTEPVAKIGKTYYGTLAEAIEAAKNGETIDLLKDITADLDSVTDPTAGVFNIDKSITIDGNGHTVTASGTQNVHIFNVLSGNVTIKDVVLDGSNKAKSGIHAYLDSNVTLTNVESKNNTGAGVIVNGATVTATGLKTSGNAWGGVDVDARDGHDAVFTIGGDSKLEETYSVYTDNTSSANVTVTINGGEHNNVSIVAGDNTTINITDGTFNAVGINPEGEADGTITVSGGKYKEVVDPEYIVDGMICTTTQDSDGYYHIVEAIKVTFEANGGNFGKDESDQLITVREVIVPKGEAIPEGEIKTPEREGYTFTGWNAIIPETVTAPLTLLAQWTVNKYTITFKNGEQVLQSSDVAYGEMPEYTGATPTKEADAQYTYTFKGWDPEITAVTKETTYTATFTGTLNKYTVKFLSEAGEEVSSAEYEYGTKATEIIVPEAPQQNNYRFIGWFVGDTEYDFTDESNIITEALTVTAKYDKMIIPIEATLIFEGKVRIRFRLNIPEELMELDGAYVVFEKNGEEISRTLFNEATWANKKDEYYFYVGIPIPTFADDIVIRPLDKDGNALPFGYGSVDLTETGFTYSAKTYAEYMLANSQNPEMRALAQAYLDYGVAAQIHFKYGDYEGLAVRDVVTDVDPADMGMDTGIELNSKVPAGIKGAYYNVYFQSDNTLFVAFGLADGKTLDDYTFMIDGVEVTPKRRDDGRYEMRVENVAAPLLGVRHNFSISDGTDELVVNVSVMSYAKSAALSSSSSESMKNLAKAMYLYYQAAAAYFSD
jgi:uncharacterized repeat protein (TIGR02543 family)